MIQRAKDDLIGFHFEAWPKLLRINLVKFRLAVQVVAEADEVVPVRHSDDSLRLNFGHWKHVLEHITDAIPELSLEVVEDEVRVSLANWIDLILQVMAKNHITEAEVGRWAIWHVRDDESIRLSTRLMYHDDVCKIIVLANFDEFFKDIATTINSRSVRYDELEFLLERDKPLAWVAAGRDEDFRVTILGILILIIDM